MLCVSASARIDELCVFREAESKLHDEDCSTPFSQRETPKIDLDSDLLSDSSATTRELAELDRFSASSSPSSCTAAAKHTGHDRNLSSASPTPPSAPPDTQREPSLLLSSDLGIGTTSSVDTMPSCGSKRSASFLMGDSSQPGTRVWPAPPPFPSRSVHVSRLGWNLPLLVEAQYVYRKLDQFLRRTGSCTQIIKRPAEYEISGKFEVKQAEAADSVQGSCQFRLNLFRLDAEESPSEARATTTTSSTSQAKHVKTEPGESAPIKSEPGKVWVKSEPSESGPVEIEPTAPTTPHFTSTPAEARQTGTHVQMTRIVGDSFVYHNLVRKVWCHLHL